MSPFSDDDASEWYQDLAAVLSERGSRAIAEAPNDSAAKIALALHSRFIAADPRLTQAQKIIARNALEMTYGEAWRRLR